MHQHMDNPRIVIATHVELFDHQTLSVRVAFERSLRPRCNGMICAPNMHHVWCQQVFLFFFFSLITKNSAPAPSKN